MKAILKTIFYTLLAMPSACLADIVCMSYDKKEYDVIMAAAEKSAVTHRFTLLLVILLLLVICFVIVIVIVKSKNVKAASSEQSGGNKKSFIKGIICVILFVFVIAATGILYSYDFVARWHYDYLSTIFEKGLRATPPCVSGEHEWEVVATERHTHKCKKCRLIQKESGCRVDGGRLGIIDHRGCQVEVSSASYME